MTRARILLELLTTMPDGITLSRYDVWEVSYYDEYGEIFDETQVILAEGKDLVRALLFARNRLRSRRKLRA